jgi:glutamine---fructose-6-phosphate transaminase (isomerizing)
LKSGIKGKSMNGNDNRYARFALVKEMLETGKIVDAFDPACIAAIAAAVKKTGRLLLTGEGSSRIFPAKNAIRKARKWGAKAEVMTEASRQAAQYKLGEITAVCVSNSGKTREVITLAQKLKGEGNSSVYGICSQEGSLLEKSVSKTLVLACGGENAVAATKSVVETALCLETIVAELSGRSMKNDLVGAGDKITKALTLTIDPAIVKKAVAAPMLYFAGYNDGVAEELTLKTNEIARKKSDFLEGTYAVHGIEEVMDKEDCVIIVDPIDEEIDKMKDVLVKGVGLTVIAIANRATPFPTIVVPDAGELTPYLYLCAGWNLLVEVGIASGIDLDKPVRARKVGNELVTG